MERLSTSLSNWHLLNLLLRNTQYPYEFIPESTKDIVMNWFKVCYACKVSVLLSLDLISLICISPSFLPSFILLGPFQYDATAGALPASQFHTRRKYRGHWPKRWVVHIQHTGRYLQWRRERELVLLAGNPGREPVRLLDDAQHGWRGTCIILEFTCSSFTHLSSSHFA